MNKKNPKEFPGMTKKAASKIIFFLTNIHKYTADNPIKAKYIQEGLQLTRREVRAITNYLRSNGILIGAGSDGFYLAKTEEEVKDTITILYKHIAGTHRAIDGMADTPRYNWTIEDLKQEGICP